MRNRLFCFLRLIGCALISILLSSLKCTEYALWCILVAQRLRCSSARAVCLVLAFRQGSAPRKPGDVAAMVNHRYKVGHVNVIVWLFAGEEACSQPKTALVQVRCAHCDQLAAVSGR